MELESQEINYALRNCNNYCEKKFYLIDYKSILSAVFETFNKFILIYPFK